MEVIQVQQLLRRCAVAQEAAAWNEFVTRYQPRLETGVRRAMRRFGCLPECDQVEDLVQEVYCRLLDRGCRRLLSVRGTTEGEVGCYLGKVAERVVADRLRAAAARKRRRSGAQGAAEQEAPAERVADGAPSPLDRCLRAERRRLFLACCRQAAGRRRARRTLRILRLALVEGRSSGEIAAALGGAMSVTGIDSLVHRMKHRLRAQGFTLPAR